MCSVEHTSVKSPSVLLTSILLYAEIFLINHSYVMKKADKFFCIVSYSGSF